jgi:hypothetical protein
MLMDKEVLQTDTSNSVVVSASDTQNLILKTTGGGNIELNPASGNGSILLKSNITLTGGKNIVTSDSSAAPFTYGTKSGNIQIAGNTISATNANGVIEISPNGTGNTYITSGNFGIGTTAPGALLDIGLSGTSLGVIRLSGSTSGNVSLEPNAIAGSNIVLTLPATSGTVALTSQISGTNSGTNTGDQTNISGNAATATNVAYSGLTGTVPTWNQNTTGSSATLTTARTIAGVSFNGSTNINIPSTGLSDSSNIARLDAANVFTNSGNTSFAGNVGVGTTAPTAQLHVVSGAPGGGTMTVGKLVAQDTTGTGSVNPRLEFSGASTFTFSLGAIEGQNTVSSGGGSAV